MKFRKKPIEIEAFQYNGDLMNSDGEYYVPKWVIDAFENKILFYGSDPLFYRDTPPCDLFIETLEGNMLVKVGDYVIKGVKGELYPCKPDIFEMTYEKVDESNTIKVGDKVTVLPIEELDIKKCEVTWDDVYGISHGDYKKYVGIEYIVSQVNVDEENDFSDTRLEGNPYCFPIDCLKKVEGM